MGLFDRVERKLESAVNGAFARAFKAEVQPVEIASAMRRAMDDRAAVVSQGRMVVPNLFTVELADGDYRRLTSYEQVLQDELIASAQEHAESQRYQPGGPLHVSFTSAPDLETGVFRVRAGSGTPKEAPPPAPSPQHRLVGEAESRADSRRRESRREPDPARDAGPARDRDRHRSRRPEPAEPPAPERPQPSGLQGGYAPSPQADWDSDRERAYDDQYERSEYERPERHGDHDRPYQREDRYDDRYDDRYQGDRHDDRYQDDRHGDHREPDYGRGDYRDGGYGGDDYRRVEYSADEYGGEARYRQDDPYRPDNPYQPGDPFHGDDSYRADQVYNPYAPPPPAPEPRGQQADYSRQHHDQQERAAEPPVINPSARPWLDIDGDQYPLLGAITILGRDTSADVTLEDPGVSRRHCEIRVTPDGPRFTIHVRDLGSTNGTYLNGERITSEHAMDGDRLTLGRTSLYLRTARR